MQYIECSDIHTTKYSGGHEMFVKIIKNAGSGWTLKKKKKNSGREMVNVLY